MKVLVLGASGYVGSRLVPALLGAGHEVVAASSSEPDPDRFAWGDRVTWSRCDVTDRGQVDAALATDGGVDAVVYLVHSLSTRHFAGRDLLGAQVVRRAVDDSGVRRLVYLSGLVPDVPRDELSPHIASRLEVEDELLRARCSTVALRAGVVIGAGSTSFEVIRQLSTLLLVQPVPWWLRSRVQPIAVSDCLRALVEALDPGSALSGPVDVGGPDVLPYPRLLAACASASRLLRLRVPAPGVATPVVSLATAGLVQAPFWTVAALVESLRHDMVCRPGHTWTPGDGDPLLTVDEAMRRATGHGADDDPERALPSDPEWTRTDALRPVPLPAHWRAGVSLARHRLRGLLAD